LVETVKQLAPPATRTASSPRASPILGNSGFDDAEPIALADVATDDPRRISTALGEFDRVLGGGIVPGALTLIGGDPGVGKSTLLLQVAARIASSGAGPVLYVSGEESSRQVRIRAARLEALSPRLLVLAETNLEAVARAIARVSPVTVVIDSIQTTWTEALSSSPGNVAQLREVTLRLMRLAKSTEVPIFLIGHVTKEGNVAGPRALEHMVDAVVYLEGERYHSYRLLRSVKNRFGSTNEVGVFEMSEVGMVEVTNPSAAFLSGRVVRQSGSVVAAPVEGSRSLLVDVQALTVPAGIGIARRTTIGADLNRLQLLVAVLTRRIGLPVAAHDVYVNVAGGMRITDPGADLALATAIASSFQDRAIDERTLVIGEVGLQGETRPASQIERRLAEAFRLGFTRCILADRDVEKLVGGARLPTRGDAYPATETEWRGLTLIGTPTLASALIAALGADALRPRRQAKSSRGPSRFAADENASTNLIWED
jgi:DNA repair protein RadA/Sms